MNKAFDVQNAQILLTLSPTFNSFMREYNSIPGVVQLSASTLRRNIKKYNLTTNFHRLVDTNQLTKKGTVRRISVADKVGYGINITENKRMNSYQKNIVMNHIISTRGSKCEICGQFYEDSRVYQIHHVNGDRTDNRIDNLALVCANCHAIETNIQAKNRFKNIKVAI